MRQGKIFELLKRHLLSRFFQEQEDVSIYSILRLKHVLLLFFLVNFSFLSLAQSSLTLHEAVELAQQQSPHYYRAKNSYEKSFWQFQNFRAGLLPQVRLNANMPTIVREINPITQPDGSIEYRNVSLANYHLGVNIIQNIGLTGGRVLVGSSLQRTDNFSGNQLSYFLSTPFKFSYQQGSLLYNEWSWGKKIEPLLFNIAEKNYAEELENAALKAAILYFNGLIHQVSLEISKSTLANSDTLHALSQERFSLGTIAKNDLLQLELNSLKAQNTLNDAYVNKQIAERNMKLFLGLMTEKTLLFETPEMPPVVFIEYATALSEARANRQAVLAFRVKRLEAEQAIAKSKGMNSIQIGLTANFGTQQTSPELGEVYLALQSQQFIGVSLDMPLLDWGLRKSQIRLARANQELTEVNLQQDEMNFEQEIYLQILKFNQLFSQVSVVEKAEKIAKEHLTATKERYLLGKVTVTELNMAQEEYVQAQEAYVRVLGTYWVSYYTIRKLTLFDFYKGVSLRHSPVDS